MLQPKKTKFRKAHKGRIHGKSTSCNTLDFGAFGLKATEPDRLTARQIEAARRALGAWHEACRPHLDPRVPGRSRVEEACRSAHGFRQGFHRILGSPGEARPRDF